MCVLRRLTRMCIRAARREPHVRTKRHAGLLAAALLLAAGVVGLAGDSTSCLAQSSTCRSICLDQYNQCRISTKGSPSCDAQYQACLQGCVNGNKR